MLVDSHCHLDFDSFASDRAEVIARAHEVGVGAMLTICTNLADMPAIGALAQTSPRIFCTAGVHPNTAGEHEDVTVEELVRQVEAHGAVGIGETGLDFFRGQSDVSEQTRSFEIHIEAARACGVPLIIHSRDADEAMADILRRESAKGGISGVMHCFTSGQKLADAALEAGFYISFSGILTFRNASEVQAVARNTPLESILVETDAPFLAPEPHRGKRNEPAFVAHTAARLAELKSVPVEELINITGDNFFRLFSKAQRPEPEAATP